jgi:outer membrane protein
MALPLGTGIQADGRTGGAASGLGPNIQNWALGATITFPAFDWFSIRAKKEIEVHNERSAAANYDQTLQDLTGGVEKAINRQHVNQAVTHFDAP